MKYLKLLAAPVFLVCAVYTELQPLTVCTSTTSILKEMTLMYLLMAVFHLPAWFED